MRLAEPLATSWKAELGLCFEKRSHQTVLSERKSEGPLVVQKPLYPEGPEVCHAIVLHPPGGIAGGDELHLHIRNQPGTSALVTTPGAGKWYRSAGQWASQRLAFEVDGTLEWLPRESIVFDAARAALECQVDLGPDGRFIGWEVVCLGRRGAGEQFAKGTLRLETRVQREGRLLLYERGEIDGGGRLMQSAAGLGGRSVFGSMIFTGQFDLLELRSAVSSSFALTQLPALVVARYLGDSGEAALEGFSRLWSLIRPAVSGREAVRPRIWST